MVQDRLESLSSSSGTVETRAHGTNVSARKFTGCFDCIEKELSISQLSSGVNSHYSMLIAHVRIEQVFRIGAAGSENLMIRKQSLRSQTLGLRNEHVAIVIGDVHAFENYCVEQFCIKDD